MLHINNDLQPKDLLPKINALWKASGAKITNLEKQWDPKKGSPVFTEAGTYATRG